MHLVQLMKKIFIIVLTGLIFSCFYSCQKDTDTVNPKIRILLPFSNEQFNVGGMIHIQATITDDNTIEWIRLGLYDENQVPVLPSEVVYPLTNDYFWEADYYLDDIHLKSGIYELRITAFDGNNTGSGYLLLRLVEIARELERVVMVTQSSGSVNVWSVFTGEPSILYSLPSDYSASLTSSFYRHFYMTGEFVENLVCVEMDSWTREWSVEPMTDPPFHLPGNLYEGQQLLYVSFRSGFVRGYNSEGVIRFATPFSDQVEPGRIFEDQELLLVDLKEKSGHRRYIGGYYLASGIERNRIRTDVEVINFHPLDEIRSFVIGNKADTGYIGFCEVTGDKLWPLHSFEDGTIRASVAVDEKNLIIAGEGNCFWYQYSTNSLTKFISDVQIRSILYDDIDNFVYLVDSTGISVYTFPDRQFITFVGSEEEVMNAHLVYNK
jgi:hypothetical protein